MTRFQRTGLTLAAALMATGLATSGGAAKAATNLKCDGCVNANDLAKRAKPAGVGFKSLSATIPLVQDDPEKNLVTLRMTTPGPGYIVYSADYLIEATKGGNVECRIKRGNNDIGERFNARAIGDGDTGVAFNRVLKVKTKGKVKVRLACAATQEPASIVTPNLIGEFFPTAY